MHQEINELINQFNEEYINADQLQNIQSFVSEYISLDKSTKGTPKEQYEYFYSLIKAFAKRLPKLNAYLAAQHGYDQYILLAFNSDDVNITNVNQMHPLHIAAINGHVHAVNALLAKNANPLAMNIREQLPIHCALFCPIATTPQQLHNKEMIFSILLNLVPETMFYPDKQGNTIFHYMAMFGFSSLLKSCADQYAEGLFIWNKLRRYPIHEGIVNNQLECVQIMLDIPGVNNLSASSKRKPLHYAAMYGNQEVIDICCNRYADLDILTGDGVSALMLAVRANNLEAIRTMLAKKVNTNIQDGEGRSALHIAVITKHNEAIALLLSEENLSRETVDIHNKKAIEYCESEKTVQLFSDLSQNIMPK